VDKKVVEYNNTDIRVLFSPEGWARWKECSWCKCNAIC